MKNALRKSKNLPIDGTEAPPISISLDIDGFVHGTEVSEYEGKEINVRVDMGWLADSILVRVPSRLQSGGLGGLDADKRALLQDRMIVQVAESLENVSSTLSKLISGTVVDLIFSVR